MSVYMIKDGELYHHGVKGMKWGVKRAKKRAARADRNIRRIEATRKNNRNILNTWNAEAREKYSGPKKAKRLKKVLARNEVAMDRAETINKYAIARNKAKKDKNYKNSAEYKKAKHNYSKMMTQDFIWGQQGSRTIDSLKKQGVSERKAKARVVAGNAAVVALATAAVAGLAALENR